MRPRERDADGPTFLGARSCPPVPDDPGHERATGGRVYALPASAVSARAHTGEVGEEGRRRRPRGGLDWWDGLFSSGEDCLRTGTSPF